ncbi:hypothetical protein HHI36_022611 [Cryptolaemus montrouzieri]|uniref:Chitin-binding type-4 domain-containing protein n=1 Tax=Cryptolaemus montrouzieri TaxID=559131 RepID=A0ABD2N096_9CUCU
MLVSFLLIPLSYLPWIKGHGRLIDPPSRASAWRYGFNTPHNYNDHELYCGGFSRQWEKNEGKCGVCGDAWDMKTPRPHEYGGTYGQGVIVRKYGVGSIMNIRIELTANHNGYFEFAICPDYKTPSQECFNKHILKLLKTQEGVDHKNFRYFPKEGNKVYEMKYRLPKKKCEHCVLQWRYIAGNNWGNCPNGTGAVGCGPQEEFRACSDITISGKGDPMLLDVPTSVQPNKTTTIPEEVPPTQEETYSPISALAITLFSFLVVCLVLFLLYFHFYQVGKQFKMWLKGSPKKGTSTNQNMTLPPLPPLPPPRIRKPKAPGSEERKQPFEDV